MLPDQVILRLKILPFCDLKCQHSSTLSRFWMGQVWELWQKFEFVKLPMWLSHLSRVEKIPSLPSRFSVSSVACKSPYTLTPTHPLPLFPHLSKWQQHNLESEFWELSLLSSSPSISHSQSMVRFRIFWKTKYILSLSSGFHVHHHQSNPFRHSLS